MWLFLIITRSSKFILVIIDTTLIPPKVAIAMASVQVAIWQVLEVLLSDLLHHPSICRILPKHQCGDNSSRNSASIAWVLSFNWPLSACFINNSYNIGKIPVINLSNPFRCQWVLYWCHWETINGDSIDRGLTMQQIGLVDNVIHKLAYCGLNEYY